MVVVIGKKKVFNKVYCNYIGTLSMWLMVPFSMKTSNENLEFPTISSLPIDSTVVLVESSFSNLSHAIGKLLALKTEHLISILPPISPTAVCIL